MKRVILDWFFFLAALWGVVGFALTVFQVTGSAMIAGAVLFATIVVVLVVFLSSIVKLINSIRSGYGIYQTPSFVSTRKTRITIDTEYRATIDIRRQLVFLEIPKKEELVDMLDTLSGHSFSTSYYNSPDSTIETFAAVKPHVMAVQWQPKTPIIPFVPYEHHTINQSPSLYGPDFLYHSIYFDRQVGIADIEIETPIPVDDVVAFVMPLLRRDVSKKLLANKGLLAKRRNCAQPSVSEDRKMIYWTLKRPKLGRIYVILAVYKGERDALLAEK